MSQKQLLSKAGQARFTSGDGVAAKPDYTVVKTEAGSMMIVKGKGNR